MIEAAILVGAAVVFLWWRGQQTAAAGNAASPAIADGSSSSAGMLGVGTVPQPDIGSVLSDGGASSAPATAPSTGVIGSDFGGQGVPTLGLGGGPPPGYVNASPLPNGKYYVTQAQWQEMVRNGAIPM